MTRAERSARNKAAHAVRRALTDQDFREARADGQAITWRQIAETYAGISADEILTTYAALVEPAEPVAAPEPVRARRGAPAHIVALKAEFDDARAVWEAGLETAMRGGRTLADGGVPARGETYPDEERDYRAANPAPVWKDFLRKQNSRQEAAA